MTSTKAPSGYEALIDHEKLEDSTYRKSTTRISSDVHWLFHGVSVITIFFLFLSFVVDDRPRSSESASEIENWCKSYLLAFIHISHRRIAPELSEIPISPVKFRGGLFETSPYRGPPSLEVDAAWERYTESRK